MRLVSVKDFDIINSLNISVSVWCGYCPIRCEGCHNSKYWGEDSGVEFTDKHINTILLKLNEGVNKDLSILGGEPFADINIDGITKLVKKVRALYPHKKIIVWTGYDWFFVRNKEVMKYIDILIDGRYDKSLPDKKCRLKGSSNQRVIDVQKSLNKGEVVLYDSTNLQAD